MSLSFFDRMAVLSAVQELKQGGSLRQPALSEIERILGTSLPQDIVAPTEAGSSVEAALAWVRDQRILQLKARGCDLTKLKAARDAYLRNAESAWDAAVERFRQQLEQSDAETRRLALRLLAMSTYTAHRLSGCGIGMHCDYGYENLTPGMDVVQRLGWICFFIGHELLDDGDPSVAWTRYDEESGKMVIAAPNEETAHPYFHSCKEVLEATFPEAKLLNVNLAHEVLDWYDANDAQRQEIVKEWGDEAEEPSEIEVTFVDLAGEFARGLA